MGLFKQPEYRRFNLKPRYWDPEAEARKEREKRIRAELELAENGTEYVPDVRAGLQREFNKKRATRPKAGLGYSTRLFLILIILLMVAFYLVTYKLDVIMKFF
ncbi:hypothetical protein [uncultured Butyricimonas sp.]|uniref:hypothetical protein n=1 Tax=uncultured Butyricimonas sp. TaxID=1268785 RepID=UPI0026DD37B2|nr:hypothetical protein [uncultured Butyricimonas sp.]